MIKYTNGFTVCFNDPKVGRKCLETLDGLLPVLKREKDFYLHATYYDEGMKLPGTIAMEAMKAGVAARRKGWQNWLILVFPDFAELDADSWKDEDSYQVPEPFFISLSPCATTNPDPEQIYTIFNKSYTEDSTIWFPKSEDLFSCDWEIANIGERDPKLLPH